MGLLQVARPAFDNDRAVLVRLRKFDVPNVATTIRTLYAPFLDLRVTDKRRSHDAEVGLLHVSKINETNNISRKDALLNTDQATSSAHDDCVRVCFKRTP